MSGFRDSIADYGYYIDFDKVHRNVDGIKVELNILNSLIGSKNIESDFESLMRKYPEVLKCIPLLLAVRANEIYCQDENGGHLFQFDFGKITRHAGVIFVDFRGALWYNKEKPYDSKDGIYRKGE